VWFVASRASAETIKEQAAWAQFGNTESKQGTDDKTFSAKSGPRPIPRSVDG